MFSFITGQVEKFNPRFASVLILLIMYGLSIAPIMTSDIYLKLLPLFLLPAVSISLSGQLSFPMNVELLLFVGLIMSLVVKGITMASKNIEEAMKRPTENKLLATFVYVFLGLMYVGLWYIMGLADTGILTHYGLPGQKTAFYYLLIFLYIYKILILYY